MSVIKELDKKYSAKNYSKFDVEIISGDKSECIDFDGKKYIDFTSGIGVNSLGFCDFEWSQAVSNQAGMLNHTSNLYYNMPQALLSEQICERTFAKRVLLSNSGAEANECAIKTARKYSYDKYNKNDKKFERFEILTLINSFHGRTITTLSATGQELFHKNFMPFTEGFKYIAANDYLDFEKTVSSKTCAILIELIQGEGGVINLNKSYVKKVYEYCNKNDILLIIDEVQTGIGRTGKLFCYEHYDITPDLVTVAKGLGGGLPIGACLFGEKCQDTLSPGDHGTTFGGNPICSAGALVVLNKLDKKFLSQVEDKSIYLKTSLMNMAMVKSVSGMGLMIGVEIDEKLGLTAKEIALKAIEKGLLVLTAKEKIRLLPPLNIEKDQLDKGIEILRSIL